MNDEVAYGETDAQAVRAGAGGLAVVPVAARSVKRIAHVGAWGRNYGDRAIQYAMRTGLERAAGEPFAWHYLDIQATRFDRDLVSELNATCDMLIVGGGGLLWQRPGTTDVSGWQWQVLPDEIVAIDIPLVLYGLGWTAFPHRDPTGTHPMFRSTLAAACEKAVLVSARNPETAERIRAHGGRVDAVHVDPAYVLNAEHMDLPPYDGPTVGFCWASDRPDWRWGSRQEMHRFMVHTVTRFDQMGVRVLLVEHIAGMDGPIREMLEKILGSGRFMSAERSGLLSYPPTAGDAPKLVGLYANCDRVYSMRKHGLIVAAGQGVPVEPLGDVAEVRWTAGMLARDGLFEQLGSFNRRVVSFIQESAPA